jgi:hypothetical protein
MVFFRSHLANSLYLDNSCPDHVIGKKPFQLDVDGNSTYRQPLRVSVRIRTPKILSIDQRLLT